MQFNNRDDIIQMTSYWTGERFQDGRPAFPTAFSSVCAT